GLAPIGAIAVLWHGRAMEGAERKAVDRANVHPGGIEACAKLPALVAAGGGFRGRGRKPQTERERAIGGDLRPYRRGVGLDVAPHLVPALSGMDVGAIRRVGRRRARGG